MPNKSLLPILVVAYAGCGQGTSSTTPVMPTSCPPVTTPASANDRDRDGLDDAMELSWARDYLPYLSISPEDHCPTAGIIVRVMPSPTAGFVHILYDVLYDNDCGIGGHIGDDERFAVTIDPKTAPPEGIVAIKAIAHKGSACEKASACGRCAGLTACATLTENGKAWPAVWAARDKHGNYVDRTQTCEVTNTCLDDCDDRPTPATPPIVNVGEPCAPLVTNLTTQGFITTANGWTNQALFNYDPWGTRPFGGADVLASDLTDPAFATPACP